MKARGQCFVLNSFPLYYRAYDLLIKWPDNTVIATRLVLYFLTFGIGQQI